MRAVGAARCRHNLAGSDNLPRFNSKRRSSIPRNVFSLGGCRIFRTQDGRDRQDFAALMSSPVQKVPFFNGTFSATKLYARIESFACHSSLLSKACSRRSIISTPRCHLHLRRRHAEDHRRHRKPRRDRQDPCSSRLVRPGTASISGTGIRSIPNGLIPTTTRFNPVQLPEPTLPSGLHVSETPNCLDIWHRGPMNGPKSPRSWTQNAGD